MAYRADRRATDVPNNIPQRLQDDAFPRVQSSPVLPRLSIFAPAVRSPGSIDAGHPCGKQEEADDHRSKGRRLKGPQVEARVVAPGVRDYRRRRRTDETVRTPPAMSVSRFDKATENLLRWSARDEWVEWQLDIYNAHVAPVADMLDVPEDEFEELLGDVADMLGVFIVEDFFNRALRRGCRGERRRRLSEAARLAGNRAGQALPGVASGIPWCLSMRSSASIRGAA